MTKKQKATYLRNPTRCPLCGSDAITADCIEADAATAWSIVSCADCGASWQDIYTLTDVKIISK